MKKNITFKIDDEVIKEFQENTNNLSKTIQALMVAYNSGKIDRKKLF